MKSRILYQEVEGCHHCISQYYCDGYGYSCTLRCMNGPWNISDDKENNDLIEAIDNETFTEWCPLEEVENESQQ